MEDMEAVEGMAGDEDEFKEVIEIDGNMFMSADASRPEMRFKRTAKGATKADSGVPSEKIDSKTDREIREMRVDIKNMMTKMEVAEV